MSRCIIEVIFKVKANVRFGEDIRVCGNVPALGCYDTDRAIPLFTSKGDFPNWSTQKAIFLPGNEGLVTYRYCIFSGGKFSRWEGEGKFQRHLEIDIDNRKNINHINDVFGDKDLCAFYPQSGSQKSTTSEKQSFKTRQLQEWALKNNIDTSLHPQSDGVIIVSYFLPIVLDKLSDGTWSAEWDEENVISLNMDIRMTWVGSVRYKDGIESEDEDHVAEALRKLNCYPIFIKATTHHQFYDMFCKNNIWPVLHHIADVYGPLQEADRNAQAQQDLWFTYTTVNRLFKDKVVEVFHEGDLIWIHGFHLMLLPSFLRRVLQLAKIGVFFHTPFPSSEIWRTMNRREDLLRGLLAADQVGFHLYEYARHFLTGCRRMLGLHYEYSAAGVLTISVDGRDVAVTSIHVGIDIVRVEKILETPTFQKLANEWRLRFPNKIIVASIDRLERLKGIPLKLLAIQMLLEQHPQWRGKLTFAIIGITAGERQSDYKQTLHDVKLLASRINESYTGTDGVPVIYFEEREDRDISLKQRLGFFAAADILMSTAPRDGLNRMPIEFTIARGRYGHICYSGGKNAEILPGAAKPNEGLVILSEFVSSARVMRGSLVVNPYRIDEVKNSILRSLEMGPTERSDRMRRNMEFSLRLTTTAWATEVLKDLKQVQKSSDIGAYSALGLGAGFRVLGVRSGFQQLDLMAMSRVYRTSNHRLILLDWGGTLEDGEKDDKLQFYAVAQGHAQRTGPTLALTELLEGLCADPRNIVFLVSGKEIKAVHDFFGHIRGLNLGAEHGFFYHWSDQTAAMLHADTPTSPMGNAQSKWKTMVELGPQMWKDAAKMVMDVYVQRTHGTYIEQKGHALIWQYRDADPEFGYLQSKELEENLSVVLSAYGGVDILRGGGVSDGYIEVRPSGISKGLFLEHILQFLKNRSIDVDFLLTVGDDSSDEPMFHVVESLLTAPKASSKNATALAGFSVTVGKKPTAARAYVDDPGAVMELLAMLNKSSNRQSLESPRLFTRDDSRSVSEKGGSLAASIDGLSSSVKLQKQSSGSSLAGNENRPLSFPPAPVLSNPIVPGQSLPPPAPGGTVPLQSSRRVVSNKSFDRLAIELQASISVSASKPDFRKLNSFPEDSEATQLVPQQQDDVEQDDGIFF